MMVDNRKLTMFAGTRVEFIEKIPNHRAPIKKPIMRMI